jgi:hypothetical protein
MVLNAPKLGTAYLANNSENAILSNYILRNKTPAAKAAGVLLRNM